VAVLLDDAEALSLVRSVRPPTPLERSRLAVDGVELWLKREDQGPNRAFKWRGALCACAQYRAEGAAETVTASTGNHGAATAWAATRLGMKAHVVVPEAASETKCEFILAAGGVLHRHGTDLLGAVAFARELAEELGAPYFEDGASDAQLRGTGTIAAELAGRDFDVVVAPLAVGALAGGIARRFATVEPGVQVVGVQVAGFNRIATLLKTGIDRGARSTATFADGLADNRVVEPAFAACNEHLADVVVVDEDEIKRAVSALFATDGILAEGAGAAALAGLQQRGRTTRGKVAVIVSGANIDPSLATLILAEAA
jgi:threonine dehydratase